MISPLKFAQLRQTAVLQEFANTYTKCSGLAIPNDYLFNSENHVFGIYHKSVLIGGFILGTGPKYRTIDVFAGEQHRQVLYNSLKDETAPTEICCFWIKPAYRTKTFMNLIVWLYMAYALKRYGTPYFLFGTCSRSLAKLYSTTPKSILIHKDFLNNKNTYVFWAKRSTCITGILEIIRYKMKRTLKLSPVFGAFSFPARFRTDG